MKYDAARSGTAPWVAGKPKSAPVRPRAFFASRTVYCPGSGDDGQPVKFCPLSHSARCFISVDQAIRHETLYEHLQDRKDGFSTARNAGPPWTRRSATPSPRLVIPPSVHITTMP